MGRSLTFLLCIQETLPITYPHNISPSPIIFISHTASTSNSLLTNVLPISLSLQTSVQYTTATIVQTP